MSLFCITGIDEDDKVDAGSMIAYLWLGGGGLTFWESYNIFY